MEHHEERCLSTRNTADVLALRGLAPGLAGLALFAPRAQTGANPVLVKVRDSGRAVFRFSLRVAEKEQS
jgi:hypothetical protein